MRQERRKSSFGVAAEEQLGQARAFESPHHEEPLLRVMGEQLRDLVTEPEPVQKGRTRHVAVKDARVRRNLGNDAAPAGKPHPSRAATAACECLPARQRLTQQARRPDGDRLSQLAATAGRPPTWLAAMWPPETTPATAEPIRR